MLGAPRDPGRTPLCRGALRTRLHACIGVACLGLVATTACKPSVDTGCDADDECDRGEMCDLELAECVPKQVDVSSTETPAPAAFTGKPVPFFRGRVCTVHDVKAGEKIPIRLDPCLHPCLSTNAFHHKHYYSCVGSRCEAWAMMYVDASAVDTGCPADAFSKFDPAMCVYDNPVDLSITATINDEPVLGTLYLEVPFLNNADTAEIAADFDNTELIRAKIEQYPQDPGRHVGGMDITLSGNGPVPPAACESDACPCYDVGF